MKTLHLSFVFLCSVACFATTAAQLCDEASGFCSFLDDFDPVAFLEEYPNALDHANEHPLEASVLCPFLRILKRTGIFSNSDSAYQGLFSTASAMEQLDQRRFFQLVLPLFTSLGQIVLFSTWPGFVNLEALHRSFLISHDCGLTFPAGSGTATQEYINTTIADIASRQDADGHVVFDDVMAVKQDICDREGVTITNLGIREVELLWGFLGGDDRGYIEVSDVERFLNGRLPMTIGLANS